MKKIFTIFLVAVVSLALSSCGAKKGDGSKFYGEPVSMGDSYIYIQHSTMHCPAIKNGTRNCKSDKNFGGFFYDIRHNTFCSKCMDDSLIAKWTRRYEEIMAAKKQNNNF